MAGLAIGNAGQQTAIHLGIDWYPSPFVVAAQFDALGVSVRSFREPLKRSIQQVLSPSFQKNFDVGGRPPWKALSEAANKLRVAKEGASP